MKMQKIDIILLGDILTKFENKQRDILNKEFEPIFEEFNKNKPSSVEKEFVVQKLIDILNVEEKKIENKIENKINRLARNEHIQYEVMSDKALIALMVIDEANKEKKRIGVSSEPKFIMKPLAIEFLACDNNHLNDYFLLKKTLEQKMDVFENFDFKGLSLNSIDSNKEQLLNYYTDELDNTVKNFIDYITNTLEEVKENNLKSKQDNKEKMISKIKDLFSGKNIDNTVVTIEDKSYCIITDATKFKDIEIMLMEKAYAVDYNLSVNNNMLFIESNAVDFGKDFKLYLSGKDFGSFHSNISNLVNLDVSMRENSNAECEIISSLGAQLKRLLMPNGINCNFKRKTIVREEGKNIIIENIGLNFYKNKMTAIEHNYLKEKINAVFEEILLEVKKANIDKSQLKGELSVFNINEQISNIVKEKLKNFVIPKQNLLFNSEKDIKLKY